MRNRYVGELATDVYKVAVNEAKTAHIALTGDEAAADGAVMAATAGVTTSAGKTVTADLTNPPYPRNLIVTPAGTTTDVKAGNVTVTGTNMKDEVITEAFAFLENASTATTGDKAFKTVTSVHIPQQDGTGCTFAVTFGSKLGLPFELDKKTCIMALHNGAIETTAPTMAIDDDEVEKNTITLNTTLDGEEVDIYLLL